MNTTNAEQQVRGLLREKSYKKWLLIGIALWVVLALLNSFLFTLAVELLKLVLALGGLASLCYAGWVAYPDLKKKYNEEINKKS